MKNNAESYRLDVIEILNQFHKSKYFKNRYRDFDVRLALFISSSEPDGLQSTIFENEFNKLLKSAKEYFNIL